MPDEEMGCGCGCNDCECKEINVCDTTERVLADLRDKLMVFADYVCTIALTPCSQLGKVMSKVVYYLWCMLKDLVNMVINNRKRTETLMDNDEYFCDRMSAISEWTVNLSNTQARNHKKLLDFSDAMSNLSSNVNTEGYLPEVHPQPLIFRNEPHAIISSVEGARHIDDFNEFDNWTKALSFEAGRVSAVNSLYNIAGGRYSYYLDRGVPATVTYTGLEDSYINGIKISKVEYIYTLNSIDFRDGSKTAVRFDTDPTSTLHYFDGGQDGDPNVSINMKVKFFDENGTQIPLRGSVLSLASLNSTDPTTEYEGVGNLVGAHFIPINGSSIKVNGGVAKPANDNSFTDRGSKFNQSDWDSDGSPHEYYGAIAALAEADEVSFDILSRRRNYVWFAFNSKVKTPTAEIPALEPLPTLPYECNIKEFEC